MLHRYLIAATVSILILIVMSPFWLIKQLGLVLVKIGDSVMSIRSPKWFNRMVKWSKK